MVDSALPRVMKVKCVWAKNKTRDGPTCLYDIMRVCSVVTGHVIDHSWATHDPCKWGQKIQLSEYRYFHSFVTFLQHNVTHGIEGIDCASENESHKWIHSSSCQSQPQM